MTGAAEPARPAPSRPEPARFDGAAYAAATAHHRAHDDAALAGVVLREGAVVLDVGCGVGDLTAKVWDAVQPGGRVIGLDVSESVLATARASAGERPGLDWVAARAQDLLRVVGPASADVVLSVAALHWLPAADLPGVLEDCTRALRPGGVLRIDMGGQGQLADVVPVLDAVSARHGGAPGLWHFPAPEPVRAVLEAEGAVVEQCALTRQRRSLPDAAAAERWLRSQLLPAYLPTVPEPARGAFTADAVREVLALLAAAGAARGDDTHDVEYVRLHVLAHR